MSIHDPFSIRFRWWVIGWFEQCIQTLITNRILLYHQRLVRDGFIPDLSPPYPERSSADVIVPQDRPALPREPVCLVVDECK